MSGNQTTDFFLPFTRLLNHLPKTSPEKHQHHDTPPLSHAFAVPSEAQRAHLAAKELREAVEQLGGVVADGKTARVWAERAERALERAEEWVAGDWRRRV